MLFRVRKEAIDAAVRNDDKKLAKILKYKIKAEETKLMFDKIKRCRGNSNYGLSRIKVPSETEDEWITIDTPLEIETKLMKRNQKHFGQAKGTFPTVPSFCEKVDWGSSTHTADLILEGDYTEDQLNEVTSKFVSYMKRKTEFDEIPAIITILEWEGKIKAWKESTSTSPSGFHLGHSKALIANHGLTRESSEAAKLEAKQKTLVAWQVELINVGITNQHTFERLKVVVNVMILKTPGDVRIHRLCVVRLYKHDYTLLLAVKWRQLIQSCDEKNVLHPHQYGAVLGRNLVTPIILEELQFEISRASKRPLIHNDYDATACYDKIIMNLAGLIARGYEQNRSIVFINKNTLKKAKYVFKTK